MASRKRANNGGQTVGAAAEAPSDTPDVGASDPDGGGPDAEPADGLGTEAVDEQSVEDTRAYLKGLLEAILFASDRPLTSRELARAAKIDKKRTEELVAELSREHRGRGIRVEEVAGGLVLRSSPVYATYVRNFLSQRPVRLSRAQLETLSIVAYRQPITRPEVDDIRGVDCGPVLKGLLERDLIKILGKKDEPGRPMLYGTTPVFLELFSMKSLRDMPTLREFSELSDESKRIFERETGDDAPEGPVEVEAADEDAATLAAEGAKQEQGTVEPADAAVEPVADDDDDDDDDE